MTDQQQWEIMVDTLDTLDQATGSLEKYKDLIQEYQAREKLLIEKLARKKDKKWGFSLGASAGFLFQDRKPVLNISVRSDFYILFWERLFLIPGINVNIQESPGVAFSFGFGFLF